MVGRLVPKAITLRLTSEEAAALAVCRSLFEATDQRRYPIKAVYVLLLKKHLEERLKGDWDLPVKHTLAEIAVGQSAERLAYVISPETADLFRQIRIRTDNIEVQYGEADILRTLILKYGAKAKSSKKSKG